jgi:hypothetical protein
VTERLAPPPSDPASAPPRRRPGSVRRTTTLLMHWPDGVDHPLRIDGRARDLLTPSKAALAPVVLDEAAITADITSDRTVTRIEARPARATIGVLVGSRGGGKFRSTLDQAVPGEREAGTGLYLLLDDLPGTTLIAPFGWLREAKQLPNGQPVSTMSDEQMRQMMEGVCSGFRPGSSGFGIAARFRQNVAVVPPLGDVTDPWSWHELGTHPSVAMRRARRIDVWRDGDQIAIDAMFRDSCWTTDGWEVAVHEYQLEAALDPESLALTSLRAIPRVLPYPECPAAASNVHRMIGSPVPSLRSEVLLRLQSIDCCTHLNDALRSLADVPVLAARIG